MTDPTARATAAGETPRRIGDGGPVIAVAHRGDPIAHRENTISAVEAALDAGADMVEIDVKTTSDGVSVVLHDDTLTRLWGDDRNVRELAAADLPAVGVPERIPMLAEVLAVIGRRGAALMIDMDSAEWAPAARYAVRQAGDRGQVDAAQVLWCGERAALAQVRAADPDARMVLSWGEDARDGPPSDQLVEQLRPEAFNPHWRVLDAGGRDWARAKGLPLCCWTVDDPAVMRRLIGEGVDAIISNRIAELREVIRQR